MNCIPALYYLDSKRARLGIWKFSSRGLKKMLYGFLRAVSRCNLARISRFWIWLQISNKLVKYRWINYWNKKEMKFFFKITSMKFILMSHTLLEVYLHLSCRYNTSVRKIIIKKINSFWKSKISCVYKTLVENKETF